MPMLIMREPSRIKGLNFPNFVTVLSIKVPIIGSVMPSNILASVSIRNNFV